MPLTGPLPLDAASREERIDDLRRLVAEYRASEPLSQRGVALVVDAVERFLRGDGSDLADLLRLKAPRGRKDLTPAAIASRLAGGCVRVVYAEAPASSRPAANPPFSAVREAAPPSERGARKPPISMRR